MADRLKYIEGKKPYKKYVSERHNKINEMSCLPVENHVITNFRKRNNVEANASLPPCRSKQKIACTYASRRQLLRKGVKFI